MWNGSDALGYRFRESGGMTHRPLNRIPPRTLIAAVRQTEVMLCNCLADLIRQKTKEAQTARTKGDIATARTREREIDELRLELGARALERRPFR